MNNELSEPVATQSESAHEPELGLAARFEGVSREIHLSPNESERYYREQGKTYSLQKRTFWVGALTLIMLTLYTWYTAKMYSANKKSADAATKAAKAAEHAADIAAAQLELTERPWIVADIVGITSPLTFDKEGAHIVVEFTVKNTGNSPAVGLWVEPEFYARTGKSLPTQELGQELDRVCERSKKVSLLNPLLDETLFPGTPIVNNYRLTIDREEIQNISDELQKSNSIIPEVFICVAYRASFKPPALKNIYATGIVAGIYGKNHIGLPITIKMGARTVPQDEMQLRPEFAAKRAD